MRSRLRIPTGVLAASVSGCVRLALGLGSGRASCARAQRARRFPTGRPSGRRGRCRRARSSSRPTRCGRSPNGMQVIAVLHHEQPAVSMRLLVRAGSVQDPAGQGGRGEPGGLAPRPGDDDARPPQQIADQIDFIGGALGTGSGSDLSFVNVIVMKDSFDVGMDLLADVARNPAFAPEEIERQKQQVISNLRVNQRRPRLHRQRAVRSAGLRVPSLRTAEQRHARDARGDHARRPAGLSPPQLRAEQHDPGDRRRRHQRGGVRGGRARVRRLAARRDRAAQDRRAAAADAPHRHRRQAGRRADRDPRRAARDSAQAPGLPGVGSGGEDPRRRRGQPAAPRAALGARADLRRRRPTPRRGSRPATSSPKPTRARRRPAKRCG